MNPKPVVALHYVSDDVQSGYDYLEHGLPGRGERFLKRYFEVTDRIAANPWVYPVKFDDYHRALVPQKSNLAVYYFQEPELSVIVAVVDARRNPRLIRAFIRGRRERR